MFNFLKKLLKKYSENKVIEDFNQTQNSISFKNSDLDNLLPGEIILLNWVNKKGSILDYPKYFEYQYYLDVDKSLNKLLNKNLLIDSDDLELRLSKLTIDRLKNILNNNNEKTNGKKSDLITRIIDNKIDVKNFEIPNILLLTDSGKLIIDKYDYIVQAHQDRFVDVQSIINIKKSVNEVSSFSELKKMVLHKDLINALSNNDYGLARSAYLGFYDQHLKDKEFHESLMYIIVVILSDLSGLDNNYDNKRGPMVDWVYLPETIYQMFLENCNFIDEEDFEDIFNRAVNLFNKQKYRGFIDSKNIKFIFSNITRVNGDTIILKYFRDKYKNKNLNKYYNSIGIDF